MAIAFERWSELMAQSVRHDRPPHRNQFLPSEKSSDESSIESAGPKFPQVTPRASRALFETGARCYVERGVPALVPAHASEWKASPICAHDCPPLVIHT